MLGYVLNNFYMDFRFMVEFLKHKKITCYGIIKKILNNICNIKCCSF